MEDTFRLLISARDPGAANNLAPVARLARDIPGINLTLVAGTPADAILRAHGLQPRRVTEQAADLPHAAAQLIEELHPDAILVGLSGPQPGIDEALLGAAQGVPTWALQDFWGDLNSGFGAYADTYLVRDELAARITRERAAVATVVTGSPALQKPPDAMKQQQMKTRLRRQLQLPADMPVLVLADQPLWCQPGYRDTLRDLLITLPRCHLLARMHPRDAHLERCAMRRLLRRHCAFSWSFSEAPLDVLLAASDLLLSAYSNTGLDRALFNHAAPRQAGTPVFLMHQPRLRQLYLDWTGLRTHPLETLGAAVSLTRRSRLKSDLRRSLAPATRRRCATRSKSLSGRKNAALRVLQEVTGGRIQPSD